MAPYQSGTYAIMTGGSSSFAVRMSPTTPMTSSAFLGPQNVSHVPLEKFGAEFNLAINIGKSGQHLR